MPRSNTIGIAGLGARADEFIEYLLEMNQTVIGTDPQNDTTSLKSDVSDFVAVETVDAVLEYPLDGLIITTPNRYHETPAKKALTSGIDVLVEKPLAHNLATAEAIVETAKRAPADCYVTFQPRCSPIANKLKNAISEGVFGELYHAECRYARSRGIPAFGSWMTSANISGGGALIDVGVHILDLIHFLKPLDTITDAHGTVRQRFDPSEYDPDRSEIPGMYGEPGAREQSDVEDSATGMLTLESDFSISIETHWAANQPPIHDYRLYGTKMGIYMDFYNEELHIYNPEETEEIHSLRNPKSVDWRFDRNIIRYFLIETVGKNTPLATAADGLQVQRIVDNIYRAASRQ
jgi:predicted dehydrogenase